MDIPNTSISPEEAQASSADERIQRIALELKKEQNSRARIASLPDELLLEVFMILKSIPLVFGCQWYRVNWVCCHWRSVAVAAPVLWTNPPTRKHDLTLLMLERSKMADLDIYMNPYTSMDSAVAVLRHVAHIQSLCIVHNFEIFKKTRDLLLGLDRPRLRLKQLKLICNWDDKNSQFPLSIDMRPLWSQLRYLHLSGFVYDWSIFPLPELEHLILAHETKLVAPISTRKLVETLAQMPKLKELTIFLSNIPQIDNPAVDGGNITDLPSLSNLSVIYEAPHELRYLLTHLNLPRLSSLSIGWDNAAHENDGNYSRTIEAIASLIIKGIFGTGLKFLGLHNGNLIWSVDRHSRVQTSPGVQVFLDSGDEDDEPFHFVPEFPLGLIKLAQSKLSSLVRADIDSSSITQQVLQILGQLPSLEHVSIQNGRLALVTSALTIPSDLTPESPIPFPKLESITFSNLTRSPSELIQFRGCLMVRCNCGIPVKRMTLAHCDSLLKSEVAVFRDAVWDLTIV